MKPAQDPRDKLQEAFEESLSKALNPSRKSKTPEEALKEALEDTTPERPGTTRPKVRDPFEDSEEEWI